ncbi:DMT family transporter [Mycolicibacterium tokaiense]|uniref:DMT family transporter n=1 Tax=Mycolicibacterium tokaiense TaxID=39695 RepID=UPI0021F25E17|nr:DMT family transporter [Mycolicibacterium tokaiense]
MTVTRVSRTGLWWGLLGVLSFSFTVVFTRVAVEGLSPLFIGAARAVVAAVLAGAALALTRQARPTWSQCVRLMVIAAGIVLAFPILTSYALTSTSASHAAVVIALLPAATAVMAVLRGKESVRMLFWLVAAAGAVAAVAFAVLHGGGPGQIHWSDLLLFAAVLGAAIGYAEGGLLARELGAWQTISWALVVAAPVMIVLTVVAVINQPPSATAHQWAAFGYLAAVSMFLGFFAWYRGLAIGPIAQVSQVQLIQPVLSVLWAAVLLHERLTWQTVLGAVAVIACAGAAVRIRLDRQPAP